MKNVYKVYNDCMRICLDLNIPVADFDCIDIKVNTRSNKRWGKCSIHNGEYTIEIAEKLLKDDVSEEATFNTMIHELLHTCPECMNHGKQWKHWADIINTNTVYTIKTTTSYAEKNIEPPTPKIPKYTITCRDCNKKWHYNRAGTVVQKVDRCMCPYCHTNTLYLTINR